MKKVLIILIFIITVGVGCADAKTNNNIKKEDEKIIQEQKEQIDSLQNQINELSKKEDVVEDVSEAIKEETPKVITKEVPVIIKKEVQVNNPKPEENKNTSIENKVENPFEDFKAFVVDFRKELLAPYDNASTDIDSLGFLTVASFESKEKINLFLNVLKTRKRLNEDSDIISIKYVNGVLNKIDSYGLSEEEENKFLNYFYDANKTENFTKKYWAEYEEFTDRSIELYNYMLNHPDDFYVEINEKTQEKEIWFKTQISLRAYDDTIYRLIDLDRAMSKEYLDTNRYINVNINNTEV